MRRPLPWLLVLVAAAAALFWIRWDRQALPVEHRLDALAAEINESTTDGLGLTARAAQLGTYFTDDVTLDLGRGSATIHGRAALLDMMSTLQPRTSASALRLVDTGVVFGPDRLTADVVLTAQITRRGGGEDSIDAWELAAAMTKADGTWRIARLRVVEAFR